MTERAGSIVPARRIVAITPSNTVDIEQTRGLHINTAGDIKIQPAGPECPAVTITVVAGILYPYEVTRVYATGTTATLAAVY